MTAAYVARQTHCQECETCRRARLTRLAGATPGRVRGLCCPVGSLLFAAFVQGAEDQTMIEFAVDDWVEKYVGDSWLSIDIVIA